MVLPHMADFDDSPWEVPPSLRSGWQGWDGEDGRERALELVCKIRFFLSRFKKSQQPKKELET